MASATCAGSIAYFVSLATNVVFLTARVDAASAELTLTGLTAAAATTPGALAVIGNGTRIIGSVTYTTTP